jgi:NIMA (never in mitosis gene a)-related kinase
MGVILLEMCLLRPPFDANSLPVLALKISKGEYFPVPKHYSKDMRRLVAEMLQVDPFKRPSITEVLRHPLIEPRITVLMGREAR